MAEVHRSPQPTTAKLSSRVCVPEGVLFQNLEGEAVLLNQVSGKYYGLDQTGTRMWELLAEHGEVETVFRALIEVYDAPVERLQNDLLGFVDRLSAQGLLEVHDG